VIDVVLDPEAWSGVEPGAEALLDEWRVGVGDPVHAGQTMASVVLVKATLEVVAPVDGTVAEILVPAADSFGPGRSLARLNPLG